MSRAKQRFHRCWASRIFQSRLLWAKGRTGVLSTHHIRNIDLELRTVVRESCFSNGKENFSIQTKPAVYATTAMSFENSSLLLNVHKHL